MNFNELVNEVLRLNKIMLRKGSLSPKDTKSLDKAHVKIEETIKSQKKWLSDLKKGKILWEISQKKISLDKTLEKLKKCRLHYQDLHDGLTSGKTKAGDFKRYLASEITIIEDTITQTCNAIHDMAPDTTSTVGAEEPESAPVPSVEAADSPVAMLGEAGRGEDGEKMTPLVGQGKGIDSIENFNSFDATPYERSSDSSDSDVPEENKAPLKKQRVSETEALSVPQTIPTGPTLSVSPLSAEAPSAAEQENATPSMVRDTASTVTLEEMQSVPVSFFEQDSAATLFSDLDSANLFATVVSEVDEGGSVDVVGCEDTAGALSAGTVSHEHARLINEVKAVDSSEKLESFRQYLRAFVKDYTVLGADIITGSTQTPEAFRQQDSSGKTPVFYIQPNTDQTIPMLKTFLLLDSMELVLRVGQGYVQDGEGKSLYDCFTKDAQALAFLQGVNAEALKDEKLMQNRLIRAYKTYQAKKSPTPMYQTFMETTDHVTTVQLNSRV